jgi:GT2 family glycosyltransferase
MTDPQISIVIVNWNAAALLEACLESLAPQVRRLAEVIVVDNGSRDASVDLVRRRFPWAALVLAGENRGFAEGCNLGIAASHAPWVATLNNDATVAPDWLEAALAAAAAAPPRLGMMQCRMAFASDPSTLNSTGVRLFPDGCAEDRDYGVAASRADAGREIFCPTAGAALYRRSMLDEVRLETGWFDRDFFLYSEDVDLGWRCRLAGWDAAYLPSASVFHEAHATTGRRGWRFVKTQCAKNRLRTLIKNASGRFLARSLARTALDLLRIPAMGGPAALAATLRGAKKSAGLRRAVTALTRVDRVALERRWALPRRRVPKRSLP